MGQSVDQGLNQFLNVLLQEEFGSVETVLEEGFESGVYVLQEQHFRLRLYFECVLEWSASKFEDSFAFDSGFGFGEAVIDFACAVEE